MEHHLDQLLYGFVHYESRFCHFTETCGSYPAHDVFNFHDVCKDRVVYPYFMPILILSVVFGSLRHLLVIISPYSMSPVIYFHYINLSIFRVIIKVKNLGRWVGTKGKPPYIEMSDALKGPTPKNTLNNKNKEIKT